MASPVLIVVDNVRKLSTSSVIVAPMGSLTMASHFRNEADRGSSFAWRSSGMMTVGPVTTKMAPTSIATGHDMPATTCAARVPNTQLSGSATATSRSTPDPAERSSRRLRLSPTLKHDDRHCHADCRAHDLAERDRRADDAGDRAGQCSNRKQRYDRRKLEFPAEPLAKHSRYPPLRPPEAGSCRPFRLPHSSSSPSLPA